MLKNTMLKNIVTHLTKQILMGILLAVTLMCLLHNAVASQSSSLVHFIFNTPITNTSSDPSARGRIDWTRGKANTERLKISLTKLKANTAYQLVAFIGDNTTSTSITSFTTNQQGDFTVVYVKNSPTTSTRNPLPSVLEPICNVRELNIINSSQETVLRIELTKPELVERALNNSGFISGAVGNFYLKTTPSSAQFQFQASGLTPNTDYQLIVNGNVGQPYTSDNAGTLMLTALPPGSPDSLNIKTLVLTDTARNNVVLSSEGVALPCTRTEPVSLVGRALDTTPPTVIATDPANAATGVALNKIITAKFSEIMNPATINTTTMTLQRGITPVAGTVTYAGVTATFTPTSNLAPFTTYTVTLTMGVKDLAGNTLGSKGVVWKFTTGTPVDMLRPTVRSTNPANGATGVALNKIITATFSEIMNPATINTTTMILHRGITPVAGTVTYAGVTATFTPTSNLAPLTTYTVRLTTGVKDLAGNTLASKFGFVWRFTTGTNTDTLRPMVISTNPLDTATGVALNQIITANFSEPMNSSTINTTTMTLQQGLALVTGTVTYAGVTATFIPSSNLAPLTTYTVTITTGAQDLANNALASNFVWSFTTGALTAGQLPVSLGASTNFAILAGSTVTNTGLTIINGDLGVSPGAAVTGFPPGIVNGTIYTGVASAAGLAKIALSTAFNDAAGRTVGPISVSGNLGGQTLAPGLYKSTSSLSISSGDLTLDAQGDSNAVFIFQIASTLTTTSGRQVILSGGAKASNIFWQVGSSATLGSTTIFKGNILAQISITLQTGATLEGRALTQTGAVSLDASSVTIPAP